MTGCPHLTVKSGDCWGWEGLKWFAGCNTCEITAESEISRKHALQCLRAGQVVPPEESHERT